MTAHRLPESSPIRRMEPGVCRSGDGCREAATRGRFGAVWCERHGAELESIARALGMVDVECEAA